MVYIDGEWQCGQCGVGITSATSCSECGIDTTPSPESVSLAIQPQVPPSQIEEAVHALTNTKRQDHSEGNLSYSPQLSAIALKHSRDMAHQDYFDHASP